MNYPQAYHITWGTYGTRLPGSAKPHVTLDRNVYQTALPTADPKREQSARDKMRQPPVYLSRGHRVCVDRAIIDLATRYDWTLHALAPQSDHVHVVITAPRVGQDLRDALKAITSRWLNQQFAHQKWWAEHGSCKYLYEDSYFNNATQYVRRQREI
ncbi:MAG TPA: transposase [Tepidisphaeraceae bacterium]|jgi:REP element-mobilizing transposase RayT